MDSHWIQASPGAGRLSKAFRSSIAICLTVAAAVFSQAVGITDVSARDRELPNIVFILADDLGIGDVGCYNPRSRIPTPHLDRLARHGMRLTNAYSAAAVCVPSRYSLLTGRHAFRGEPLAWTSRPTIAEGQMTIGSLLQSQGYATGCIGKWHCGFDGGVASQNRPLTGGPLDRGFDDFFGQHGSLDQPPYFYIRGRQAVEPASLAIAASQQEGLSVPYQGRFWRAGKIAPGFKHQEVLERYAEEARTYVRQRSEASERKPFFLYLALTAPHGPWLPDKRYQGTSQAGPLGDFVVQVDDIVGRLLAALEAGGMTESTLIFLTSDNGPLWFDPDVDRYGHDSSGGFRGRKGDIWEGGIRMPLIARWPGRIPANSTSDELVGLVDVLATLAAVVGQELPDGAGPDSHNMLPVLLNKPRDQPIRDALLLQSLDARDVAIRQGPWKLIPWLGSGGFLTLPARTQPREGEPPGQLYNLEQDPAEQHNLYLQHPEIVARLSDLLAKHRQAEQTRPE